MRSTTMVTLLCLGLVPAFAPSTALATPLSRKEVPAPLASWTAWALHGHEDILCPPLSGRAQDGEDAKSCAWPSRLSLGLDERAGRFAQEWQVYQEMWVPLPGGQEHWPLDVRDGGRPAVVVESDGKPGVILVAGHHALTGSFAWDSMPESLPVPPATGLLSLVVRGARIPFPERGEAGEVFLERTAASTQEDTLDLTVHRKVTDDIPLLLTTRLTLSVSGKSREILLGKTLPARFLPLAIESPLPVRMEADSRLRMQVRPGTFTVEIVARHEGPAAALARPDPQGLWKEGDELWVFEPRPNLRIAVVSGVPAIDPQQTTLPEEWKRLSTYAMAPGATMRLEETRRGDSDPAPDRLSLARTMWLDFDGGGYTVSDSITGSMHRSWRLEMNAPVVLGRVAIGGRDQLITHLHGNDRAGVEVRQGKVALSADSRIAGDLRSIPVGGWDQDFERVTASLALPPGWRLLHASGADSASPTWVKTWTLYDLFLLFLIGLGAAKLFGWPVGILSLVALALTFPESDAPKGAWLAILAGEALLLLLRQPSKLRSLLTAYLAFAWLGFAIVAVPFIVQQIRQGLHPAHEQTWSGMSYESSLANLEVQVMQSMGKPRGMAEQASDEVMQGLGGLVEREEAKAAAAAPMAQSAPTSVPVAGVRRKRAMPLSKTAKDDLVAPSGAAQQQVQQRKSLLNVQDYDPNAMVQTGPGVPAWTWHTVNFSWNGPVERGEKLRLVLIGPQANLVLMLVRVALFALLVVLLLRPRRAGWTWWWRPAAAVSASLVLLLCTARPARASEIPPSEMLDELRAKLTALPDCAPNCTSISRMAMEVSPNRLHLRLDAGAAIASGVPLPGGKDQWVPEQVTVDGRPAPMVRSDDGFLVVSVLQGGHVIVADGPLPDRDTVQISLPMKPHHVVVRASGWTVAGVHEDGAADADLQLTRIQKGDESHAALRPNALPPYAAVERTLILGLRWEMDTVVVRQSPLGSPIVLEVPLLPGESVTTQGIRVTAGKALVNIGAQESRVAWHSTLSEQSPLELIAPRSVPWAELWRLDASPVWHTKAAGIPPIHNPMVEDTRLPEWHPWPGEKLTIEASRPAAVPGQTLTIQGSQLRLTPGLRTTDGVLSMQLRSSRGGQHDLVLPDGAEIQSVKVNGVAQPVRKSGSTVTLPISPGQERLEVAWRQQPGIRTWFRAPAVDLRTPSVNSEIRLEVGQDRWILLLGGPRMGPSVLCWSLILALVLVGVALGRTGLTPLRPRHWVLLGLGLSQIPVESIAIVVAWLLAFGWRRKSGGPRSPYLFNLLQLGLLALTVAAVVVLFHAVEVGLLQRPDMGISGNRSTAAMLSWFQDRNGAVLPQPWVLSVPLFVYRLVMLLWAIWLATSLLRWARWLWQSFGDGGFLRRLRKTVIAPPTPPAPPAK